MTNPSSLTNEPGTDPAPFGTSGIYTQMLTTLFEYSIWARDRHLPLIQDLEKKKLKEVPAELQKGVYGSIHDTLAHMAQSQWLWIQRCMGESPLRLPKGEDFVDLTAIINWWNSVHADSLQYLSVITDGELERVLTYTAPDGKRHTRKIWHMLLQVPNHQTEHRSQIATMLGSMGLQVPPTDMVVYLNQLK
ncbi:MAG TPA: DinB family protein [Chloroflexia bacterium]|nr:DinB family protein [Chloroflexia bacterium]